MQPEAEKEAETEMVVDRIAAEEVLCRPAPAPAHAPAPGSRPGPGCRPTFALLFTPSPWPALGA